jgi:hypothetical protein
MEPKRDYGNMTCFLYHVREHKILFGVTGFFMLCTVERSQLSIGTGKQFSPELGSNLFLYNNHVRCRLFYILVT